MRNAYISALHELAKDNRDILALIADNGAIVYDKFRQDCPTQLINLGISEATMTTVAAGLSSCGKIPFAYTIATFLTMRAFEQIRNDICMQEMNVKLVGIGGGLVYSNLGPTHHAVEDLALMLSLPNMTVFSPVDPWETKQVTYAAAKIKGPVYIRLATGNTPTLYDKPYDFCIGKGVIVRDGDDLSIITTGNIVHEVIKAVQLLKENSISARLIHLHTLRPLDRDIILKAARETRFVVTVEEHSIVGGVGATVATLLAEEAQSPVTFHRIGLRGLFTKGYGSYDYMKELNGLSAANIARETMAFYQKKGFREEWSAVVFEPREERTWARE